MTTEQIERGIELIKEMIAKRDAAANAKVIEGEAEVVPRLPAPDVVPDGPNKVMDAADTAVGAGERKPRKRVPSPTGGGSHDVASRREARRAADLQTAHLKASLEAEAQSAKVIEALACRRQLAPKILEAIRCHLGVPDRVLDVLVPEIVLQGARVVAIV